MTIDWSLVTNIATVESLATFAAGGVATNLYQTVTSEPSSKLLLEACRKELEDIAWRIKQLTPRQCQEIVVLHRQGKCKSIDEIERKYRKFLDNNDELWERYTDSSTIQRRWFFSQLILDIKNLRQQVQALWKDMCNTTTSRMKAEQGEQVEHQLPSSPPSPTAEPGSQTVEHYAQPWPSTTTIPGEYPLNVIYPPTTPRTAHITAGPPSTDMV
ncbi:hypothetical protein V8E53_010474 [Lactarius tabidus]